MNAFIGDKHSQINPNHCILLRDLFTWMLDRSMCILMYLCILCISLSVCISICKYVCMCVCMLNIETKNVLLRCLLGLVWSWNIHNMYKNTKDFVLTRKWSIRIILEDNVFQASGLCNYGTWYQETKL